MAGSAGKTLAAVQSFLSLDGSPSAQSMASTSVPASPADTSLTYAPAMDTTTGPVSSTSELISVPIADTKQWAAYTHKKLHHANRLEEDIETRVFQNKVQRNMSTVLHKKHTSNVQSTLQETIKTSSQLARDLDYAIRRVDQAAKKTRESILKLQRAHRAKWAPYCVCTKRIELRNGRPAQENTHDAWQIALELERDALNDARQTIHYRIKLTEELYPAFEQVKQEMLDDLRKKRHTRSTDHRCLLEGKHRAPMSVPDCYSLPSIQDVLFASEPASPQEAERGTAPANEETRAASTRDLISKADKLVAISEQRIKENFEEMAATERECNRANAVTEHRMHQHIKDLIQSKKPLEERLMETEKKIFVGSLSSRNTDKKMKQQEGPLQALTRQFSVRQQRMQGEHIRDCVHETLEDHLSAMKRSVKDLSAHASATNELVQELETTRDELIEALRLKTLAIRIDMSCTKVAQKAAGALFYNSPRGEQYEDDTGAGYPAYQVVRQSSASPSALMRASGVTHAVTRRASSPPLSSVARRVSAPAQPEAITDQ